MSGVIRWETCDHTSGAYWDPHDSAHCARCKANGWTGEYVLGSAYDALAAENARLRIGLAKIADNKLRGCSPIDHARKVLDEAHVVQPSKE